MKDVIIFTLCAIVLFDAGFYFASESPSPKLGNVITQGIVPQVATSSTIGVGPQQNMTLASRNAACSARVITTVASPVMLAFGIGTPTALVGHLQAASTTVSYDNAIYGCGAITAYAFASSTITVTAFSQ